MNEYGRRTNDHLNHLSNQVLCSLPRIKQAANFSSSGTSEVADSWQRERWRNQCKTVSASSATERESRTARVMSAVCHRARSCTHETRGAACHEEGVRQLAASWLTAASNGVKSSSYLAAKDACSHPSVVTAPFGS